MLVPCLGRLRDDFNEVAPDRDRASDGSIGDAAHSSSSDHTPDEISDALRGKDADSTNEVHAIDVDADLRTPGLTMEMVVQHLVARSRAGLEDRLRYIIFDRRIWEASNRWRQQPYAGPNPHDKHAHFSASYGTAAEADTHSWHLEDLVALTAEDKEWLTETFAPAAAAKTWAHRLSNGSSAGGTVVTLDVRTNATTNQQIPAVLAKLDVDQVDEPAIAAAVLAGLTPEVFAAAMAAAGLSPQALAALIPAAIRREVADELADRLAA
jgi:hypothetical protein